MKNLFNLFSRKAKDITPFVEYYPTINMMTPAQKKSYKYIEKKILSNTHVDVRNFISYLFCFLFEQTKLLLNGANYNKILSTIQNLQRLYPEYPLVGEYCESTCADIYFCHGKYDKYFEIQEAAITGKGTSTHLANELLYAKYKLNRDISGKELISITRKLTKFGKEHIEDIIKIIDILLCEDCKYNRKRILEDIATEEIKKKHLYPLYLFCGNPYGSELNQKFCHDKNDYICFYANEKFLNLVNELTRVAENMYRDSQGLPKVNEGWLEETKLFYSIKRLYPHLSVIHQYRDLFLGRQSIDIFIKEYQIGIEYQGEQHFLPIDFFGGEKGYREVVKRDRRKKMLCQKNKIHLLYYKKGYDLQDVKKDIDNIIQKN